MDDGYRTLPFPFEPIEAPPFAIAERWSVERLLGYLATWSGVTARDRATGGDVLAEVAPALRRAWGGVAAKAITWPLALRVGRV